MLLNGIVENNYVVCALCIGKTI